jgi:glycerophosphoryl diester phosphodiesterase
VPVHEQQTRPCVIAHRGSHGEGVIENTMAAFERAVALGANMIELDVRRTADDELVIFHDGAVGTERIGSLTLPELRRRSAAEVPRLRDVLDWASRRIALDVEVKEDGYVVRLVELLATFVGGGGELLVTSFVDSILSRLDRLPARRGLLIERSAAGAINRALECGADALVVEADLVSDALMTEAVGAGLKFVVWDFMASTRSHAALLRDPRVAGVITDDVPGALAAR